MDTIPLPAAISSQDKCMEVSTKHTLTLLRHISLVPFWGTNLLLHKMSHDIIALMEHMKIYHRLVAWWLQIISDYIDQKTVNSTTFLQTFKKDLNEKVAVLAGPTHDELCNDKELNDLCDTESPCAPDCSSLPKLNQVPHSQL